MVMVVVFVPPEFRTVIVNVVLVNNSLGIPEIVPVVESMLKPVGRSGLMEYS